MAKKAVKADPTSLPDPFSMMKKIDDSVEIISESAFSNIQEYIPSGWYILNAVLTGSLFRGYPSGRVISLAGVNSSGKTFLAMNAAGEAQKMGYNVLWLDSEGAADSESFIRTGCDPNKIMIKTVGTITETSQIIANLLKELEDQQEKYGTHHKFIIFLDSIANLSSQKEVTTVLDGSNTRDMTKQQEIKALFRVNMSKLAKFGVPFIVTNHVYDSMSMYSPGKVHSSGTGIAYNASITLELSPSKLNDKASEDAANKKEGKDTLTKTGILVNVKPVKSRFCICHKCSIIISFFKKSNQFFGLEQFMSWDNCGIARGSMVDEKTWSKLSDAEKKNGKYHSFEFEGKTLYCQEKDTARGIIVRHLGKAVPVADFFTEEVFTDEFLHKFDDEVIRPLFELPDQNSFEDIKEIEEIVSLGDEVDNEAE